MTDLTSRASISVGHLSSPTSESWNDLVAGIIQAGLYEGGRIVPGTGLNVKLEPFIARTSDKTIRIKGSDWIDVNVPNSGEFYLIAEIERDSRVKDNLILKAIHPSYFNEDDSVLFGTIRIPKGTTQITEDMINIKEINRKSLKPEELFGRIRSGSGAFKTGNVIHHNLNHKNYGVFIMPDSDDGSIGKYEIERQDDKAIVTNTGSSTGTFSWMILVDTDSVLSEGVVYGQTLVNDQSHAVKHNLNNANYFPIITPLETPDSAYWVIKDKNEFKVQTAGKPFRAHWAAMPINKNMMTGISSFNKGEIVHGLNTLDYKMYWVSLSSKLPATPPVFEYEENRVVIKSAGEGSFQYLIIKDSAALSGTITTGMALPHQLNRDDYIVLSSNPRGEYYSLGVTKNKVFIADDASKVDVTVVPASASWALGDWTRPAPSPYTHRLEFASFVQNTAVKGSVIYNNLCTQNNALRRAVAQVIPANPMLRDLTLQLTINDRPVSTLVIDGDRTSASLSVPPIYTEIGDVVKVILLSEPPTSTVAFSWFGTGEVNPDNDEWDRPENAPAFTITRNRLATVPKQADYIVPKYLVGANTLSLILDNKPLIETVDYEEIDETHIRLKPKAAEEVKIGSYLQVRLMDGVYPQSAKYLDSRGITPDEAEYIRWSKSQIEQIQTYIANGYPGIVLSQETISKVGRLKNDIDGNVYGNVFGTADSLKGVSLSGTELEAVLQSISSRNDSDYHWHSSDRDRKNHTGQQPLNTISDAGTAASRDVGTKAGDVAEYKSNGKLHNAVAPSEIGTAAAKDTGTSSGQIPLIGAGNKLPKSIIPTTDFDSYTIGYEKGNIPYLNDNAKIPYDNLAVGSAASKNTGTATGQVPVYDLSNRLAHTVHPDDLGSAATKDVGTGAGKIPVLNADGNIPASMLGSLGSAATKNVGTSSGQVPVLNAEGKIPSALLDITGTGALQGRIGTGVGEIAAYGADHRLPYQVHVDDIGTAASKDIGIQAGDIPVLNDQGKLANALIEGLGNAALADIDVPNGVAGLDGDGKLPISIIKDFPTIPNITIGTAVGEVPVYQADGTLYNTVAPSEIGTAAAKNTGTASGNVPIIGSNNKLPRSILDVTNAAFTETGTSSGNIPVLNSEGKIDNSLLDIDDLFKSGSTGTSPGDIVVVQNDGKIADSLLPNLGSAASRDVGNGPNNVLAYDSAGKLPAEIMTRTEMGNVVGYNVVTTLNDSDPLGDPAGRVPVVTDDDTISFALLVAATSRDEASTLMGDPWLAGHEGLGNASLFDVTTTGEAGHIPVIETGNKMTLQRLDVTNLNATNHFNKTESDNRYYQKSQGDGRYHQKSEDVVIPAGKKLTGGANTDRWEIYFESTSDAFGQSNLIFQTYDNGQEFFKFRTKSSTNPDVDLAVIDNLGIKHNVYGYMHEYFLKATDSSKNSLLLQGLTKDQIVALSNGYTDQKINDLIGGASSAYDTLKEMQTEVEENESSIGALTVVVGNKANKSDLGTAASKNVGTSSGQIPVLTTGGKIPKSMLDLSGIVTDSYTKDESNNLFYSKSHIDATFLTKTKASTDFYTKTHINSNYLTKSHIQSNYLTKSSVQADYALKSATYSRSHIDSTFMPTSTIQSTYMPKTTIESNYYNKSHIDNNHYSKTDSNSRYQGKLRGSEGQAVFFESQDVPVGGYIATELNVIDSMDDFSKVSNVEESFETVFNAWRRFSHGNSNRYPHTASELTKWSYDSVNDVVTCTINSTTTIGFVSDKEYGDYELEARISANNGDNDRIGFVLGFVEEGGREYTLTVLRMNDRPAERYAVYYNFGQTDVKIIAQVDSSAFANNFNNWNERLGGCKIKATKVGDTFKLECTEGYATKEETLAAAYVPAAEMNIDLNSDPVLAKFKGRSKFGYVCQSQDRSTWEVINRPGSRNPIVLSTTSQTWMYENDAWVDKGLVGKDLLKPVRFYYNETLGSLYITDLTLNLIAVGNSSEDIDLSKEDFILDDKKFGIKTSAGTAYIKANDTSLEVDIGDGFTSFKVVNGATPLFEVDSSGNGWLSGTLSVNDVDVRSAT